MPSSKSYIDKEQAEQVAIAFEPSVIQFDGSANAREVVLERKDVSDFRVDKIVSQMTRLDEVERQNREKEIEAEALRLSQEVQERAYQEAHELGLKHGKEEAFETEKARINEEIQSLKLMMQEIESIRLGLLKENKSHILNLCLYISERLLMKEIETKPDYILSVIGKAIEMAHGEEELTLRLSPEDFDFITEHDSEALENFGFTKKTKFEKDQSVDRGGLILDTNYGVIDATTQQRLDKLRKFFDEDR